MHWHRANQAPQETLSALTSCDIMPVNNMSRLSVFPGLMYMCQSEAGSPYIVEVLTVMARRRINIYGDCVAVTT